MIRSCARCFDPKIDVCPYCFGCKDCCECTGVMIASQPSYPGQFSYTERMTTKKKAVLAVAFLLALAVALLILNCFKVKVLP